MRETVRVGPLAAFATNRNTAMGLRGHSHTVEVFLVWEHGAGGFGYPSFKATNDEARTVLTELLARPFEGTNEAAARMIFDRFEQWRPALGGTWTPPDDYRLAMVEYRVRGVPDTIGHDDGWTTYTVSA